MVGKVRGRFGDFSGAITVPENGTPSIAATIAVGSVNTGNPTRDEHLRAPDVFGADEFPTATLVSVDMHGTGKDDWVLVVDFTLRGITKRLPLAFSFLGVSPGMGHGEVAGFEGVIKLKRSDFGVLTDTPVLAGGGPMVGDTVDVTVCLEAVKAPAAPTGLRGRSRLGGGRRNGIRNPGHRQRHRRCGDRSSSIVWTTLELSTLRAGPRDASHTVRVRGALPALSVPS